MNDWNETLQWRHNGRDGVSNHQPHDCFLNRSFRHRSKKTSKLRVTGLCAGNSPEAGEFPAQMASNAENVSISWRLHDLKKWNVLWSVSASYWRHIQIKLKMEELLMSLYSVGVWYIFLPKIKCQHQGNASMLANCFISLFRAPILTYC